MGPRPVVRASSDTHPHSNPSRRLLLCAKMTSQSTSFDEHSAWLRSKQDEYSLRKSRQDEYSLRKSRASYSSYTSDSRWSSGSADRQAGFVENSAWLDERSSFPGGMELAGAFNALEFDYEEQPVYRSLGGVDLGIAQPSGCEAEFASPPAPLTYGTKHCASEDAADAVDVAWLAGANPPLIRRQRGFATQPCVTVP